MEEFFLEPAANLPELNFLLGGAGWGDKARTANVKYLDHVYTRDHNAFNCTPTAVLNVNRDSMARFGFSPATRVFEAVPPSLVTDGRSYFPDPTLHSGWSVLSEEARQKARLRLQMLPRNSAAVRLHNRCRITGRPHGFYRKFGLSRNILRAAAMRGDIPGLIKASW